jgi:hypothetical protein
MWGALALQSYPKTPEMGFKIVQVSMKWATISSFFHEMILPFLNSAILLHPQIPSLKAFGLSSSHTTGFRKKSYPKLCHEHLEPPQIARSLAPDTPVQVLYYNHQIISDLSSRLRFQFESKLHPTLTPSQGAEQTFARS